jgi:hypothetical protein
LYFSTYEQSVLLTHTKLSREDIYEKGGPCPRILQKILNQNPLYKVKNETALSRILMEQGMLPWDESWQFPLARLRKLQDQNDLTGIKKELGALLTSAEAVIEKGPELVGRKFYIGALYFAGLYRMAFAKHNNGSYEGERHIAAEKAIQWLEQLARELKAEETLAADLIKSKTAANIVVVQWNKRPAKERYSEEMKGIITATGFVDWSLRQSELFPKLDTPVFNALAVASRFRWRHLYSQLHETLHRINPKFASYKEYNDDFDDFREWLATQPSPAAPMSNTKKERSMKRSKRIRSSLIAVIAVTTFALGAAWIARVELSQSQAIDLRAHQQVQVADLRPN